MNTRLMTALTASALLAVPVQGQDAGTLEVGAFGNTTLFDQATELTELPTAGAGAYAGFYLVDDLALEAGISFTDTETDDFSLDAGYLPVRARLVYTLPVGQDFRPIVGAGWTFQKYTGALNDETDNGVSGLIGFKNYFGDEVALRMDAQYTYVPSPFNETPTSSGHSNWTLSAGITYQLLGG